jgi:hypothetical protein
MRNKYQENVEGMRESHHYLYLEEHEAYGGNRCLLALRGENACRVYCTDSFHWVLPIKIKKKQKRQQVRIMESRSTQLEA